MKHENAVKMAERDIRDYMQGYAGHGLSVDDACAIVEQEAQKDGMEVHEIMSCNVKEECIYIEQKCNHCGECDF